MIAVFRRVALDRVDFDILERLLLVIAFSALNLRLLHGFGTPAGLPNLVLLVSEGMLVVFIIVRRRTTAMSLRPRDWVVAIGGTIAPLLAAPSSGHPVIPFAVCSAMMAVGVLLQFSAKLTLRRSFGIVAANRGVKAGGPYRLVRHPMYAGYLLTHIGYFLSGPTAWTGCIYAAGFMFQLRRILAEEEILSQDPTYRALQAAVPYRLIPFIF